MCEKVHQDFATQLDKGSRLRAAPETSLGHPVQLVWCCACSSSHRCSLHKRCPLGGDVALACVDRSATQSNLTNQAHRDLLLNQPNRRQVRASHQETIQLGG